MGMQIIGGRNRRVVYTAHAADDTDLSTYTFSGVAFGDASTRRHIIVCFHSIDASGAASSMTVGGVSATMLLQVTAPASRFHQLWMAAVPTGTSGTIVVVNPGTALLSGIEVYAAYDLSSATPYDTASVASAGAPTLDLDVPSGGIVVGFAVASSGVATFTWSGLTEDVDGTSGTNMKATSASVSRAPPATPRAISVTVSTGTCGALAASWR